MTRAAYATRASTAYYCGSNAVETLMYEDEKTRGLMGELAKKRRKWETLRVSQSQAHEAARRPSGTRWCARYGSQDLARRLRRNTRRNPLGG